MLTCSHRQTYSERQRLAELVRAKSERNPRLGTEILKRREEQLGRLQDKINRRLQRGQGQALIESFIVEPSRGREAGGSQCSQRTFASSSQKEARRPSSLLMRGQGVESGTKITKVGGDGGAPPKGGGGRAPKDAQEGDDVRAHYSRTRREGSDATVY